MEQREQLRAIVARLCRVEPAALGPDFSVAALVTGSITCHLLDSALRSRLGVEPPPLHEIRTYADLEAAVFGLSAGDPRSPSSPSPSDTLVPPAAASLHPLVGASIACGLDVEKVSNLPAAEDYWTHEFYTNTFSRTEIAYCVLQANPLPHFAARWCAKEALKKCDPRYMKEKMTDIQVDHDANGAPLLQSARTREILPYALSLSHADDTAAAVVIRPPAAPSPSPSLPALGNGETVKERSIGKSVSGKMTTLALGLALFGTIIACLALWRTLNF